MAEAELKLFLSLADSTKEIGTCCISPKILMVKHLCLEIPSQCLCIIKVQEMIEGKMYFRQDNIMASYVYPGGFIWAQNCYIWKRLI